MPLSRHAQGWLYRPDPSDELNYAVDVGALLDEGDSVSPTGMSVLPSTEAAALGLQVVQETGKQPRLADDGKTIVFWLTVDPAKRDDPTWDGWGRDLPVSVAWATDGPQPAEYSRDFVITVRDR